MLSATVTSVLTKTLSRGRVLKPAEKIKRAYSGVAVSLLLVTRKESDILMPDEVKGELGLRPITNSK